MVQSPISVVVMPALVAGIRVSLSAAARVRRDRGKPGKPGHDE
jgi:hypothetical protein